MEAVFIGKDGSMGFKYGYIYELKVVANSGYPICISADSIECPYSSFEALFGNWVFVRREILMITYHDGDILTSNADVICHQVNCKGVMGAGLAKQIKSKYPKVYEQYRDRCYYAVGSLLGMNQYIQVDDDKWIANLFCQNNYGRDKCYTDYAALRTSFESLIEDMGVCVIAIPYGIGCGLAGGDWNVVSGIINEVFRDYSGELQIWKL